MTATRYEVRPEFIRQFETFGFCCLRGAVRDRIGEIARAFDEVFNAQSAKVGVPGRLSVPRIAERQDTLRRVFIDDSWWSEFASALLTAPVRYIGGDGVRYSGATYWHRDGAHAELRLLKIVLYLEQLTRDSGALRIIPGTNRSESDWDAAVAALADPLTAYGLTPEEVPAYAIESEPGDVIAFDPHSLHASFGGGEGRRQLTLTFAATPSSPVQREELTRYLLADRAVL